MKKSFLLMLPCALVLAACSGSKLDKGSIFNEAFMKNNFTPEYSLSGIEVEAPDKVSLSTKFNEFDSATQDASASWLVHVTKDDKKGLFSLEKGEMLIPLAKHESISVITRQVYFGMNVNVRFIKVTNADAEGNRSSVIFDELGNEIFSGEGQNAYIELYTVSEDERKGNEIFKVEVRTSTTIEPKLIYYNIDGSISRQGLLSEFTQKEGEYYGYQATLKRLGHKELALNVSTTGYEDSATHEVIETGVRYSIYNTEKNEFVSSFVTPLEGVSYWAGDYFIFQNKTVLEERATDYDYFAGGVKYNVDTYRINYTTGEKENIETKILLTESSEDAAYKELVDDNKVIRYYYNEDLRLIRDDRTLDQNRVGYVLNDKFEQVADVTGINLASIQKVGKLYVDYLGGKVYNEQLHEVGSFDVQSGLYSFQGEYGKYGLKNPYGKILVAPTAEDIHSLGLDHYVLVYFDSIKIVKVDPETEDVKVVAEFGDDYKYSASATGYLVLTKDGKNVTINAFTGEETENPVADPADSIVYTCYTTIAAKQKTLSANVYKTSENAYYMISSSVTRQYKFTAVEENK